MIKIIVSVDINNGIGKNNDLLVKIKDDLKRFKNITMGNVVVMGYNTYLSLPNGALKGRENIVLCDKEIELEDVIVKNSIKEVLDYVKDIDDKDVFIIGGGSVYKQFIEYADELLITHIFVDFNADIYFPEISKEWEVSKIEGDRETINNKIPYIYVTYNKRR